MEASQINPTEIDSASCTQSFEYLLFLTTKTNKQTNHKSLLVTGGKAGETIRVHVGDMGGRNDNRGVVGGVPVELRRVPLGPQSSDAVVLIPVLQQLGCNAAYQRVSCKHSIWMSQFDNTILR
jgi:hypothetical protein